VFFTYVETVPRQNAGGLSAIRMRTFQSSVSTRIAAQFLACHAELRIYQRCTQANEVMSSRGHMSHKLSFMLQFFTIYRNSTARVRHSVIRSA